MTLHGHQNGWLLCCREFHTIVKRVHTDEQAEDAPALRERKRSNSFASTSSSGRRQSIKKEPSVSENNNVWEPGGETPVQLVPSLQLIMTAFQWHESPPPFTPS